MELTAGEIRRRGGAVFCSVWQMGDECIHKITNMDRMIQQIARVNVIASL